jgi:hypothetical protein
VLKPLNSSSGTRRFNWMKKHLGTDVQLRLPLEQPSPDETRGAASASRGWRLRHPFRIHFVRMRQARRYVMRVCPDGDLRVTIPRGDRRPRRSGSPIVTSTGRGGSARASRTRAAGGGRPERDQGRE